jgi:FtsP/CotA-like multicopper oxidase with cupredoxin domain
MIPAEGGPSERGEMKMLARTSKKARPKLVLLLASLALASLASLAIVLSLLPAEGQREAAASTLNPVAGSLSEAVRGQPAPISTAAVVSIDLCATTGTVSVPDGSILHGHIHIPIWGFAPGDCSDTSIKAQLPGPTLDVGEGDTVTVNLYNSLSENVSIIFPGQDLLPDTVGVASPGSTSYTFTASAPGTYLYEAGTNTQVQVAMGLFGPLIVRPLTAGQAYDDIDTAFDEEAVLVLSEIDPALNSSIDPNTFDMLNYDPKYWLINGKAYPDTDPILADPGDRLLFRYLNAGLLNHTMQMVGFHQRVIAGDAYPLTFPYEVVSLTVASGQTYDLIGTLPLGTLAGTKYPLYNAQQHVTNVAAFPGGMLTFVTVDGFVMPGVTCAGTATMVDALLIARHVVGLAASLPCTENADVNGDGSITMIDALTVARFVVGLSIE